MADEAPADTTDREYTERLVKLTGAGWKKKLDVQRPYRWNLRRLMGERRVLDVGCGIGRNLAAVHPDSVGVDHNRYSVEHCRSLGLHAYTPEEFETAKLGTFDGMLMAHVVEHLAPGEEAKVIEIYLPYLDPGSIVLLICPQERGFASDATHTTFFDADKLSALCERVNLTVARTMSFPFPRFAGRLFAYNEFVLVATTALS
jgi:SAM-dependent methyltransferase